MLTNEQAIQSVLARVEVVCPAVGRLTTLDHLKATAPFDPQVKAMVTAFSRRLAQDPEARAFPEIVALAHWLRPRAILDLEEAFRAGLPAGTVALGRGLALHFAPGNVDTIFLYSALLSVLAGNATVVRVSSRDSAQIGLLTRVLGTVLADPAFAAVAARIRIVRYAREAAITAALSATCDLRVIWGGDASVREIKAFPLPPRARDLPFPDRWSLSVIDAATLNAEGTDLPAVARSFANDAYWFGQMACSSPRLRPLSPSGMSCAPRSAATPGWADLSHPSTRAIVAPAARTARPARIFDLAKAAMGGLRPCGVAKVGAG